MALSMEEKIAKQLQEAGTRLLTPPSSVDELLPILDELEACLEHVEQSPSKTMKDALSPLKNALVAQELFGHSDPDVKVSVATCINEITRITAPDPPYNDDQMKEIFQLIVSSFEKLDDMSSRSYKKRTTTLETVARVRSSVMMLELQCDTLILEMFQHFFKSVRDYHPKTVFTSMETIMALVLEECVDISPKLFSLILEYLKKVNKNGNPVARRLSECVLMKCASEVKSFLVHAIKTLGTSLDDYNNVLASVCQELSGAVELNGVNIASNDEVSEADASGLKDDKIKAKETSSVTNNEESTFGRVGASSKEAGITIDSDTKTTKLSSKKVESVSYQQNLKKIKRKRASLLKDNAKPPPKKVSKKSLSSPKFATKSAEKEPSSSSCKRKCAGGKEKASEINKHGEELVGSRIEVWWPGDKKFYKAVVESFNSSDKRHKVMYDDGDVEVLRLGDEKWGFINDDTDSDKGLKSNDDPVTSEISPHKSYKFQKTADQPAKPADQPAALPAPKEFREISETIVKASSSDQTLLRIEGKLDTLINLLQNFVSK